MIKTKWDSAKPTTLPPKWKSGLDTCGLGVAVHEEHGLVANLYTGKLIKPSLDRRNGSMNIRVPVNLGTNPRIGTGKILPYGRVVRLVCDAGKVPEELESERELWVYHKNGDKTDNTPDNLVWATPRMAMHDALEMGSLNTKLTPEHVKTVRQVAEAMKGTDEGLNCAAIAKAMSVSASHISDLLRKVDDPEGGKDKVWKHWNFVGMPEEDWEPPAPVVDKIQGACKELYKFDYMQSVIHDGKTIYDY